MVGTDSVQIHVNATPEGDRELHPGGKRRNWNQRCRQREERRGVLNLRSPLGPAHARDPARCPAGGFLANGADLPWPRNQHQDLVLKALTELQTQFAVVPFDSITAAWTDGEIRDWTQAPFTLKDLRKEVQVVVPSTGEEWREIVSKDKYGHERTKNVHTLGNSVIRVRDRLYLSGVDETGRFYRGIYFLAELATDRPPSTFEEALSLLKPRVVQEAEARGANVRRQGEWFTIPTKRTTSQLLADVERGVAVRREKHILGRDGHHQLEEAVIYRFGPQKGDVYARGVLTHTNDEHTPLDLGFRWHLLAHNVQGASYSLGGNFD